MSLFRSASVLCSRCATDVGICMCAATRILLACVCAFFHIHCTFVLLCWRIAVRLDQSAHTLQCIRSNVRLCSQCNFHEHQAAAATAAAAATPTAPKHTIKMRYSRKSAVCFTESIPTVRHTEYMLDGTDGACSEFSSCYSRWRWRQTTHDNASFTRWTWTMNMMPNEIQRCDTQAST